MQQSARHGVSKGTANGNTIHSSIPDLAAFIHDAQASRTNGHFVLAPVREEPPRQDSPPRDMRKVNDGKLLFRSRVVCR